jgi:molybdenum cofactor cytidylyltransferase
MRRDNNMAMGIILAGGYSSRAKSNKMVLKYNNIEIIRHAIMSMQDYCSKIIVVTGHYHDDILNIVKDFHKVKVVRNVNYSQGMFSSVKVGVKEINDDFFITPGDYPLIMKSTYEKVLKAEGVIRVPTYNNRRGHPLFISKELISPLLSEPDDSNLKTFRNKHIITNIETNDSGILKDIDTVNDYIKLKTERKED